jgi:hypothetical protein
MIKVLNDLPDNVVGISAEGKLTGTDYETILIPVLEEKLKTHPKIRMLYQLGGSFSGFDLDAFLDDAKMGMKHLSSWDRIALVSDHEIINSFAKFFGYLMSCELRIYKDAELEKAKEWISEK